jgi:site-specific DNA recombinase
MRDESLSGSVSQNFFAIIYTRVSSGRQVENASLETQERICTDYCERNGWRVLKVFREEGESAKSADRTQLAEALRFCREQKPRPSYFVVYDVKRFARNAEDHHSLRKVLASWDIKLRSATQGIGERPEERFLETILSGESEYDNAVRKERSVTGMATRLRQGAWTFKAPLGYINTKQTGIKTIVPDPERAPLIREAFERYATGIHNRQSVLDWINDKGLRTWKGKRLSTETFRRMLANPLYAARIVVQGTKDGAGKDWRFAEKGSFRPIVPDDVFDKVQSLLSGRRPSIAPRRRAHPDFPLRHFVRCGSCGKPLTASKSTSRTGEKYSYYHCQNKNCASRVSVPKEQLETDFLAYLRQLRPNAEYLKVFRESVVSVYKAKFEESLALRDKLERDLRQRRDDKWKLNEAFIYRNAIRESDYKEMKEALEQEIVTLELKVNDARQDEIEIEELLDFAENLILNAAGTWNQSSLEQRQRLQQVLFPQGVTYSDRTYRTSATSPMFKLLEAETVKNERLVALPGIEPGFED